MRSKRNKTGMCIIETVVGAAVLVPICLFGLDILTIVLAESINEHLAKDAARSAANQASLTTAESAARNKVKEFRLSAIISSASVDKLDYSSGKQVSVQTKIDVKLPAPFPFFEKTTLFARSTEAVVGTPAAL